MFCAVTVVLSQPLRLPGRRLRAIVALMLTALAATLCLITPATALSAEDGSTPNIVLIVADDKCCSTIRS